jgi:methionyl-tRNA formyltransferase
MSEYSFLFLGKQDDAYCERALKFLQANVTDLTYCLGKWGDPLPEVARDWEGDYIVSYLSRWVVPDFLLQRAKKVAINFHPASPEYPGIGCNNFALYENASEYGVTCHHMAAKVDTGGIIAVSRFPMYPSDDIDSLLTRTYDTQIKLFYEIIGLILAGKELPVSDEKWTRPPFSRKQFNELFKVTPEMDAEEIARRIRAISYQHWQPYVELNGYKFYYKPDQS